VQVKRKKGKEKMEYSVRTGIHGRHFPNLPGGEITIECTSFVKHCTTATTKSPTIITGGKQRGESIVQKILSVQVKRKKGKEKMEYSVRTGIHGRHFPNLPGGNVCIKIILGRKDP
jgi:hypothetical protein